MRLNAKENNNDRDYIVLLNGQLINKCFEADDIEGWAKVYKTDDHGHIWVDQFGKKVKILHGKVEFFQKMEVQNAEKK